MKHWHILFFSFLFISVIVATPVFAQFYQSKATKQTAVGDATLPNSVGNYAEMLMKDLMNACGTYVNANKVSCINNIPENSAVKNVLIRSAENDYNLQCVGFAEAVATGVGADYGSRDACDYVGFSDSNWQWIQNANGASIQIGDIPVWCVPSQGVQHIAVVTDVKGNGYQFTVAEANGGSGTIDFDPYYSISNTSYWYTPRGWIRKRQ